MVIYIIVQILWIISSIMIFACGIYFCFRLKFIHLSLKKMIKSISKKADKKNGISSFGSLTMSLAGRIGVGSLSGIVLSVYLGGPGVLFWIWISSFLCAGVCYAESVLAGVFRKKDKGGTYLRRTFLLYKRWVWKK